MKEHKDSYNLDAIQRWMQAALVLSSEGSAINANAYIASSPRLDPKDCLAIYQRSYYSRLLECMRQQYKALCHALGPSLFTDFAREYLRALPSQSPTLSELGARFPQYLQSTRPDNDTTSKEIWIDFMVELAQYEWDLYVLFDAAGWEGKPYAEVQTKDELLSLQPCLSIKEYNFPVHIYYEGVATQNDPEFPQTQKTYLALARKNYKIGISPLHPIQHFFLKEMKKNASVEEALKAATSHFKVAAEEITKAWEEWKSKWTTAGIFIQK